jgi:hypothetical protein
MNIDNLMREHKGIFEEINYINVKLAEKNLEADLLDVSVKVLVPILKFSYVLKYPSKAIIFTGINFISYL